MLTETTRNIYKIANTGNRSHVIQFYSVPHGCHRACLYDFIRQRTAKLNNTLEQGIYVGMCTHAHKTVNSPTTRFLSYGTKINWTSSMEKTPTPRLISSAPHHGM